MLVRLMYCSRATSAIDTEELVGILRQSRTQNPERGITGVLCLSRGIFIQVLEGGIFIQVLEGGRASVNALYNKIASDPRHAEVTLLAYEEIAERRFAGWSMGQVQTNRLNPAMLLKYSETATLDPYAVSGEATAALFEEMMASAAIMGQS